MTPITWNPDLSAAPDDEAILLLFSDDVVEVAWRYDKAADRFYPFAIWNDGIADYTADPDATKWPGDLIGCVDLRHRQHGRPYPVAWASMSELSYDSVGAARAIIEAAADKALKLISQIHSVPTTARAEDYEKTAELWSSLVDHAYEQSVRYDVLWSEAISGDAARSARSDDERGNA